MAKTAIQTGDTGQHVARNILRLRKARALTVRGLSELLATAGRFVPASGITKMEQGERRIDVDDLTALAGVFGVSPSALLLPLTDDPGTTVEITGVGSVPADEAWDWVDGRRRLDQPCPNLDTACLEYALHSRPPIRRTKELGRG
jgi:transcriptional regulator with XRE-family HTH domain